MRQTRPSFLSLIVWEFSTVGSASASKVEGREFKSCNSRFTKPLLLFKSSGFVLSGGNEVCCVEQRGQSCTTPN